MANRTQEPHPPACSDSDAVARQKMVEDQIRKRGVRDARVLQVMMEVPRHEFVPQAWRDRAYEDGPLPIGEGQTISQPYMVAVMTAALDLRPADIVLEVGTGCGYQAAILSKLAGRVYTIEVNQHLAATAKSRLDRLGFKNVEVLCGDGTIGLHDRAPFDAILIAAAAPTIPAPLLEQLNEGGRLIAPVGDESLQELTLVRKKDGRLTTEYGEGCRFVPLTGRYGLVATGES